MGRIYIEPQKGLQKYTCPHCNTISQMEVGDHKFQSDLVGGNMSLHFVNVLEIHRCQCCGRKILWIDDKYIYPDIVQEEPNEDMPLAIKHLYTEAALISNKSPRAACIGAA